jgi:putative ABC transport system permease protein
VLEEAPQFHVLLTRIPDKATSARFQQQMVKQFPNVSIIDLSLVLSIVDELLSKVGFVIRFMAGFSIFTGLIVLIASVLISKYQRIQESVLLRTLGASRKQIFYITALEYFFLGALASATGIVLSMVGSWLLARFIFETEFSVQWLALLIVFVAVCMLTVLIGLINSRAVVRRPPLEILREEV